MRAGRPAPREVRRRRSSPTNRKPSSTPRGGTSPMRNLADIVERLPAADMTEPERVAVIGELRSKLASYRAIHRRYREILRLAQAATTALELTLRLQGKDLEP